MSSSYPSSSYTGGLGRFSSIFLSLFAIDQLRKIKSHRMETIIHKMRRDQERPNQSVFSVHSAFRFNHWRQDVTLSSLFSLPSIDEEIKTTSGYWAWALKDVHRGRPLAFPFIPIIILILGIKGKASNIILILRTPCDLSCSSSCWWIMVKSTFLSIHDEFEWFRYSIISKFKLI